MESRSNDNRLVETTIMAIREQLMEYFKGTCIERFTTESNITLRGSNYIGRHNYEREDYERRRPCEVLIADVPIMTLKKSADEIVFYDKILGRSPQFRKVKKELELFLKRYLQAIEVKHEEGEINA